MVLNSERGRYVLLGWQLIQAKRKRNSPARRVRIELRDCIVALVLILPNSSTSPARSSPDTSRAFDITLRVILSTPVVTVRYCENPVRILGVAWASTTYDGIAKTAI